MGKKKGRGRNQPDQKSLSFISNHSKIKIKKFSYLQISYQQNCFLFKERKFLFVDGNFCMRNNCLIISKVNMYAPNFVSYDGIHLRLRKTYEERIKKEKTRQKMRKEVGERKENGGGGGKKYVPNMFLLGIPACIVCSSKPYLSPEILNQTGRRCSLVA